MYLAIMEKKNIKVLYEDDELLVLEKPAGWVTTKENYQLQITNYELKNKNKYLEDWVGEYYPNKLLRNGIVHRLDKGTSGMVVVARTEESLIELKRQFKQRLVRKRYYVVVCGDLSKVGEVDMPINRSRYTFGKFKVSEEGKRAVTEFEVIKKFKINGRVFSVVDINLKTGRTHQIRVHFSYLGWPLLGDKVYGGQVIDILQRPFLHAYKLEFSHPVSQKQMLFQSEMAADLQKVLEIYG